MNKTVLIFDDDHDIGQLCALLLTTKGFKVVTHADSTNVLSIVQEVKPAVILMDNSIPGHGGVMSTLMLKRDDATKHIPVIFFTANSNIENLMKASNADHCLKKPFDIVELENLVNTLVHSGGLLDN